jgi:DNA topoisomerase-1
MPVRRMVFHEITPQAIRAAIENPRDIDRRLVDAQEARRILDRLYGYPVSEVLWRKVGPGLSAGRVQSVAVRIIVQRERERMAFVSAGYWDLDGVFATAAADALGARLVSLDGQRLATGKDFASDGSLAKADAVVLDEGAATSLAAELTGQPFTVAAVDPKPYRRSPAPPFITSTLQQEAGRKLRISAQQAMRAAQSLYEGGYITYMRTDSTTLSATALAAARDAVRQRFGAEYLPDSPRQYTKKVKNAQEAHEAIRPAGESFRAPDEVARQGNVGQLEARLYELIWQRTVASQMTDAVGETVTVRLRGQGAETRRAAEFATSGTVITHQGFQRVYVEDSDDADDGEETERRLPPLRVGDNLTATELEAKGHETQPPPRYTEASLVKRLEELGVGRPSTYASIMGTIQDRDYVRKRGSALVPNFVAFAVTKLLETHLPDLVDYAFTARMEDDLDEIAKGEEESIPWLSRFYFGTAVQEGAATGGGLRAMLSERLSEIDAREINTIPLGVDADGVPVGVRIGKYGPYLERGEQRAGIPDDLAPDELTMDRAMALFDAPSGDRELGTDPASGLRVQVRNGRFGPYVQMGEDDANPRRASLFKSMRPEEIGLDDALALMTLPRVLGEVDGEEVIAQNGRFGPFVKKGNETRSLATEDELLTITMPEALAVLAEPKRRRGQGPAKPPLAELAADPVSGKAITVKEGRFGPYVTDGETNASLRKGDNPTELTWERATELLAERRAKLAEGGGKPARRTSGGRRATAGGKTAAGKAATKKTTKKTGTKKSGPKT